MKRTCCWLLLLSLMLMGQPVAGVCETPGNLSLYFPLEADHCWAYAGEGIEFAEFTRNVQFKRGNRTQISEYDGGTRKMIIFQVFPESVVKTFSRAEVYENTNFLQEPPNQSVVVLKAPLAVGSAWEDAKERREIVGTTATVSVPAGTFRKVVVVKITPLSKETAGTYHRMEYYAAGTGLILQEFIGQNDFRVVSRLKFFGREKNCKEPSAR